MSSITWLIVLVGLVQLPIICDVFHHMLPESRIPRLAAKATRPMFQIMSGACGVSALYLYFGTFLPVYIHERAVERTKEVDWLMSQDKIETERTVSDVVYAVMLSILAVYIVGTMMWHYTVASAGAASPSKTIDASINPPTNPPVKRCTKCNIDKHAGVHHCRTCERCITLFDHHCPFTASCIGQSNFRSFWIWLTGCTIGLIYSCSLSYRPFSQCIINRSTFPKINDTILYQDSVNWMYETSDTAYHQSINQPFWTLQYCRSMGNLPLTFLCVAFGLLSVGLLWIGQTWLIHRRMTTMEFIVGLGKRMNMHKEEEEHTHANGECAADCASKPISQPIDQSINQPINPAPVQQIRSRRKSWSLVHRNESLHRTLLPDSAWSLIDRVTRNKRDRNA